MYANMMVNIGIVAAAADHSTGSYTWNCNSKRNEIPNPQIVHSGTLSHRPESRR